MRKLAFIGLLILAACSHSPTRVADSGPSQFGLRPFEVQTLENGLKIIWIKDTKVPEVSMALAIRAGGSLDPDGEQGLAGLTAQLLDKGLKGRGALRIAEDLEQRADYFGAGADADATFVSIRGLSFHAKESLDDFYELAIHPIFPATEVEREKKLSLARLKKIVDRPGEFANRVYGKYIFGQHPYANDGTGSIAGVGKIRRDDIVRFHKQFYSPDLSTLAVVGQFDDAFKRAVVTKFSNWQKTGAMQTTVATPKSAPGLSILAVEKPELQQTEIRMGHLGVKRNIPDHLALKVATTILGDSSSFSARLWNEIRVKRGLTYGVRAAFDERLEPGPFVISTFTRNDKVHEMVDQLLVVFRQFHDKGVTDAEVESAKAELRGRFPHLVETGDDLAHELLTLDLNGVSFDYLRNFQEEIDGITTAQVNAAIANHFQPENLKLVVFAPAGGKVMETLKEFGPVTVQDYKKAL